MTAETPAEALKEELRQRAFALGFQRFGVARAEPLSTEGERLRAWLSDGRHGAMQYMADTADVRADVTHPGMLPSAASVVILATSYARTERPLGPAPGRVARYAQGRDYHNVLQKRARKLAQLLREKGHAVRVGVDTLPIFERAWAQRAGLGFIGKNCCLIVPGLGSHVLLTALVTSAELAVDAAMKERCGDCRACLTSCPTSAFRGPRELDARRCISYLTIEQRGPIPLALRSKVGSWLFGCDACQDICPYNRTAALPEDQTAAFRTHPRWREHDAASLLTLTEAQFSAYAEGSPIKRPGRVGMARNAATVLGNSGDKRHLPVL
ncbi:MAG: Epoxyqueuosine (oQ) reductase QueG, partial [Myxococcaceae bacterium]|nr:Epoxyqueuosine (oQ) reductase QueG [Myxococcaceae bacterium]